MTDLSSAEMHSDAKNFLSFINAGVDPRTGTYSFNLSFSQLFKNALNGPSVPLSLNFDMFSMRDVGFGLNWSIPLSRYDRAKGMLYLSNGTSYRATFEKGIFSIPDKKVKNIVVNKNSDSDELVIRHKSGLVEVLGRLAYGHTDEWVVGGAFSPEGRQTRFRYDSQLRLHSILDDQRRRLVAFDYSSKTSPLITFWPDSASDKIVLGLDVSYPYAHQSVLGRLRKITMSGQVEGGLAALATWRFKHDDVPLYGRYSKPSETVTVISEVQTPGGGMEKITYKPSSFKLSNATDENGLPAVVAHDVIPGGGQPNVRREFTYSQNNYRQWNPGFTVKNSAGEHVWASDYEYSSIETLLCDRGRKRTTTRTYDRYHLLTKEVTELGKASVTTETRYHTRPSLSVFNQSPIYQLPRIVKTTYLEKSTGLSRSEVTITHFDDYGNLLSKVSPSGVAENYEYYSARGEDGCPADQSGIVRWVKKKTVRPAARGGNAPSMSILYRYKVIKSKADWLQPFHVPDKELLFEGLDTSKVGAALKVVGWDYETDINSKFLGKMIRKSEKVDRFDTVFDHRYEWVNDLIKVETTRSSSRLVSTSISWQNELTGNVVREKDQHGVVIETRFDALGRKILETVAPNSPCQAQKAYSFKSAVVAGRPSEEVNINASGALKRIFTDGLNRTIAIEVEDSDAVGKPIRNIYKATFNSSNQLVEEIHQDWLDGQPKALVIKHLYDDWGSRIATVGADGVTTNDVYHPVTMTRTHWKQSGGKTVEKKNAFDKVESIERFDKRNVSVGAMRFDFDGLGRCISQLDREGIQTTFSYDFFGRLVETRLPDDTVIKKEYAKHSTDNLPARIWVNNYMAGEREYDALSRVTQVTVGGRTEKFTYQNAHTKPARQTTASGKVIEYKYEPALNNQVIERTVVANANQRTRFKYHPTHAALNHANSMADKLSREYSMSGQLEKEVSIRNGVEVRASFRRSLNGLELESVVKNGVTKRITYDHALRVIQVSQGPLAVNYRYDLHGRVNEIVSREASTFTALTIRIEYDDFDREVKRRFMSYGRGWEELTQKYNRQDKLTEKVLSDEQGLQLKEIFEYDPRGRLCRYGCQGARAPADAIGNVISHQTYQYDSLDNITRMHTTFSDGKTTNDAFYFYENEDKTQLTRVENSNPDYAGSNAIFTYDQDGNQRSDERRRQLNYDELGRLTSVEGAL